MAVSSPPKRMVIGETHPLHIPPWTAFLNNGDYPLSPFSSNSSINAAAAIQEVVAALQPYMPLNKQQQEMDKDFDYDYEETDSYSFCCDSFMMFEFKVRMCTRGRSHDWTGCPHAHPGEKARRRDPRKYHYSGTPCPDFRKGYCKKGDACEFSHGVFECWLHPVRYRTQPCKDGPNCTRKVCFFAHAPDQLRVLTNYSPRSFDSYDGSPLKQAIDASISPPAAPLAEYLYRSNSINEMVASLRNMQLRKMKSFSSSWHVKVPGGSCFGSPLVRPGFCSLPTTPTSYSNIWDNVEEEEEPAMMRVESGKCLRGKMFEKLSKENLVGAIDSDPGESSNAAYADVGWVSELVK